MSIEIKKYFLPKGCQITFRKSFTFSAYPLFLMLVLFLQFVRK